MINRKKFPALIVIAAAVVVFAVIAAAIAVFSCKNVLILKDADSGELYASFPLPEGKFSVTFTHSVNKSPYTDYYEVIDSEIYAVGARFFSFGAGVTLWPFEDGSYRYDGDGAIVTSGAPVHIPRPVYLVGTFEDSILEIGEESFSLVALCGKGTAVEFSYR